VPDQTKQGPIAQAEAAGTPLPPSAGESQVGGGRAVLARVVSRILGIRELVPAVALIVLVLVDGLTHSRFFASATISANFRAASGVAIIAFGMVFLLAMGEIDLSVGGIYGMCFFICAKLGNGGAVNMYLAALIAVAAGVGLGLVNGFFVWLFRAPTIIVTLGTFSLFGGLVAVMSGGEAIGGELPHHSSFFTKLGGEWLGLPVVGWIALVLMVVLTVLLTKSRLGAMIRAVGSNRPAAVFAGIPAGRLRTYCLMLTGGLAGLSGVLTLAYAQSGDLTVGNGIELQVIAAAIIGGTAISGGSGSVPGGMIGALLVATINSGLVFFDVDPLWNNVVTGVVILVAVGSTAFVAQHRAARIARAET
jgi:ribose transport system permease protein